jgi:hypothetical protein
MNNNDYQEMPCISSHWLKDLLVSPAYCYQRHLAPDRETDPRSSSLDFGSLVHCLTLNPLQFVREFTMQTLNRRTKDGRARYNELTEAGWIVITPDEFERARAIVAALKAHPDARLLLRGGQKEKTFIQERERGLLPLKARLDIHHAPQRLVVELKTIHDLHRIQTAIHRYRYPLSAAFYADISQALSVHFIFVQTQEPYEVEVFEMPRLDLQEGREHVQSALRRFDECWLKKEWPEAEPQADLDDDPLMMPAALMAANPNRQRFDLPIGELAL